MGVENNVYGSNKSLELQTKSALATQCAFRLNLALHFMQCNMG